jgi:ABC-type dipeptide/oligopeptide/nickel transport system permease subunit
MADFWKRFSRNRQAVLGLIILCIVIFVAAIANIIYPGDPFLYSKFPLSAPGENGFRHLRHCKPQPEARPNRNPIKLLA